MALTSFLDLVGKFVEEGITDEGDRL